MSNQKKPYVKPNIEFHPAGSPAYNRFIALLEEEQREADQCSTADPAEASPNNTNTGG